MNQERTVPASKPLLDERAFHRLLCAAYTLQQHHRNVKEAAKLTSIEPAIASNRLGKLPKADAEPTILAIARPAQRHDLTKAPTGRIAPRLGFPVVNKINSPVAWQGPKIWRTVEALAIGTVFGCFMVSASIPWFSSRAGGAFVTSQLAKQQSGLHKAEEAANPASLSSKSINRPERLSQHVQSSLIARDTVVRYMNLPAGRHLQATISGGPAQVSGAKRSGFARDTDMIASDTVLRYDKDLNPSRKPATGKALPIVPEPLRSSAR